MKRHFYLVILLLCIVSACSEDEPALNESFFKVYDDTDLDLNYRPIDMVETIGGYIILTGTERSNTDFMGIRLMKVDDQGDYQYDSEISDYVVPVGKIHLNTADSNSYFFAMNPTTLQTVLLGVNPQLGVEVETTIAGLNYPLSSNILSNGNLLLQTYDPVNLETEISEIGLDGTLVQGAGYSIGPGADVEVEIINHYLNATDRPLPFFCGEVSSGNYYFNGFYNYSFSLVFTDFSGSPTGVVQGQSSNAGLRAVMPLAGSNFAIAGYQFDENYQLASAELSMSSISSSADLYPGNMAEFKSYTPTNIISYTVGFTYAVFAAETKGRHVHLNFYDSNGQINGTHRIGYLNPYTFSSIKVGSDNALLILGTTFVAGRFERISLNKISQAEVATILN